MTRDARRYRCSTWAWLALLLSGVAGSVGACEDNSEELPVPPHLPTCRDTDRDGYDEVGCRSGIDCDDTQPYIHPNIIDGPWSLQTRYVERREVVQWFSIEGDTSHWLTQTMDQESGKHSKGLKYYQGSGIDIGIPQLIDPTIRCGHDASLLLDGTGAHVLHRTHDYAQELRYTSDALDWEPEIFATTVGPMRSRMVMVGDELHVLFRSEEETGEPLRYAIRRHDQWQLAELGQGRADQLIHSSDGQLHIIASDTTVCFHHGQSLDGESWSFEDYVHDAGCEVLDARVGQDDRLHVLYFSFENIWMTSYDGEQWSAPQLVDAPTLKLSGISPPHRAFVQVDAVGVAHVTFAAVTIHGHTPVFYLENSSGEWTGEIVARQLSHMLALSPEGEPIIALSRVIDASTHPQLAIARRTGNDGIDQNCNGVDGS